MNRHYRNSGKMIGQALNPSGITPPPLPKFGGKGYTSDQMRGAYAATAWAMRREGQPNKEILEYLNRFPGRKIGGN